MTLQVWVGCYSEALIKVAKFRVNNHMHSDSKKRRFALLFAAGDVRC